MTALASGQGKPGASKGATSSNVGRENVFHAKLAATVNWEDQCAKLTEENTRLKVARNQQEQLLKDLNTKFRKLAHDVKWQGPNGGSSAQDETSCTGKDKQIEALQAKLTLVTAQRDDLQVQLNEARRLLKQRSLTPVRREPVSQEREPLHKHCTIDAYLENQARGALRPSDSTSIRRLRSSQEEPLQVMSARSEHGAGAMQQIATLQSELQHFRQKGANDGLAAAALQRENESLRTQLASVSALQRFPPATVPAYTSQMSGHEGDATDNAIRAMDKELQALRQQSLSDAMRIDALTRERDSLLGASKAPLLDLHANVDPVALLELQRDIREKTVQLGVLTSRFSTAQAQIAALQEECKRLVSELHAAHEHVSETQSRNFKLEAEKGNLEINSDRCRDLEKTVSSKNEELMRCEQEMLRLVDNLQSCTREAEHRVRRECNERFAELERIRDEEQRVRKAKETELIAMQQELREAKRKSENCEADATLYKEQLDKLRHEHQDLLDRSALLGGRSLEVDDTIHKAVAIASLQKKTAKEIDVRQLWEGIEWNEGWEVAKMREAMSTAAMDVTLAQQRCESLEESLSSKDQLLKNISSERDDLLGEVIELRQRLSGIQTSLIKKVMIDASHADVETAAVILSAKRISCDLAIAEQKDGSTYTPSLFLTVEGLEGYECALGDTFYSLDTDLETKFAFNNLPLNSTTLELLRNTNFVFHLNQSLGVESQIVAVGALPGEVMLRCRHTGSDATTNRTDRGGRKEDWRAAHCRAGLQPPLAAPTRPHGRGATHHSRGRESSPCRIPWRARPTRACHSRNKLTSWPRRRSANAIRILHRH